jgi:DNA-binding response OmpR family regulator
MQEGKVVVVEDDPTNRMLITQILRKQGFEVWAAPDGKAGKALVLDVMPDVVVSDIQMPNLDGIGMLAQLRAESKTATLPVVMLTSLTERNKMRESMAAGADDYLTKPFTPTELVDTILAQMKKRSLHSQARAQVVQAAVNTALENQRHSLAGVYERRLKKELSESLWGVRAQASTDTPYPQATLMFVDLINPSWPQLLSPSDLAEVLRLAYSNASDTLSLFGANHVHMVGEGLLAVFIPTNDTASMTHATRAMKSALALVKSSSRVDQHLRTKFADRSLPRFSIGIALHSGPVVIASMGSPDAGLAPMGVPVGESVKVVMRLQQQATHAQCALVASESAIALLQPHVVAGRQGEIDLLGDGRTVRIAEVLQWRD